MVPKVSIQSTRESGGNFADVMILIIIILVEHAVSQ